MTDQPGTVVAEITSSVDGFVAGPHQTAERPFGDDGGDGSGSLLHGWMFDRLEENRDEVQAMGEYAAVVMGRTMFGPVRGEWTGDWRGWWGDEPVFHCPVFVLTHHPREPLVMAGGTTYHFVTDGIHAALERARAAAGPGTVSVLGGAATINQYLAAGLLDELRLHVVPLVLGAGARLFEGVPPAALEQVGSRAATGVTHLTYRVPR